MTAQNQQAQQISCVTLGISSIAATRRFYGYGFGWTPVFENEEILFYQMNGLMLGLWQRGAMATDMNRPAAPPGSVALAHNVASAGEVDSLVARLVAGGAALLREPSDPPHGGRRGVIADPDGHAWEIAFNPAWPIDSDGRVTFGP
jgi:catechol 2,3-dioxygenase-like lactoylglutathione lyase family enzyme